MADEKIHTIQHEGETYKVPVQQEIREDRSVTFEGLTTSFTREFEVVAKPQAPPTLKTAANGRVTVDPHYKSEVREVPFADSAAGAGGGGGAFSAVIGGMNAISASLQAASGEASAAAQVDVPQPGEAATVFACVSDSIGKLDDLSTDGIAKTARVMQGTADTIKGGAADFANGDAQVAAAMPIG